VTGGVTPVARTSAGKLQQRGETQRSRSMARRGSQVHGKAKGGVMKFGSIQGLGKSPEDLGQNPKTSLRIWFSGWTFLPR